MKVIDTIEKVEKDLTADELVELMMNHDRQVDLILPEKKCVDGRRFIRSYFNGGKASSDFSGYNKYDLKGCFLPEEAIEVRLG